MDYTQLESNLLFLINTLRRDPKIVILELTLMLDCFKGNQYADPTSKIIFVTYEGSSAVKEAIFFLSNQPPLQELYSLRGLYIAAKDHAEDIGNHGVVSHKGTDESRANHRVERYGIWQGSVAENIVFEDNRASAILLTMIIDDGNLTRSQRNNIFSNDFRYIGIGCSSHQLHKHVTVINFVVDYKENEDFEDGVQFANPEIQKRVASVKEGPSTSQKIVVKDGRIISFARESKSPVKPAKGDITKSDYELPAEALGCKVKKSITVVGNTKYIKLLRLVTYSNGDQEVFEDIEEEPL